MFKKEEEINSKSAETVIGPSIKVKGNFFGDGDIIVEGRLDGAIKTANSLLVGSKAVIKADIEAKQAKISGEVRGNLLIQNFLEITSTAKIYGDVQAAEISIEKGAVFNGNCTMSKDKREEAVKKEVKKD